MIGFQILLLLSIFTLSVYHGFSLIVWASIIAASLLLVWVSGHRPQNKDWVLADWFDNFVIGGVAPLLLVYSIVFRRALECIILLFIIWLIGIRTNRPDKNSGD